MNAIGSKIVCNFDTSAAETVFPKGKAPGVPTNTKSGVRYRTASMEYLEDDGGKTLHGEEENGNQRKISGRMTGLHRVLASGSRVCQGCDVILFEDGGYLMPHTSKV